MMDHYIDDQQNIRARVDINLDRFAVHPESLNEHQQEPEGERAGLRQIT